MQSKSVKFISFLSNPLNAIEKLIGKMGEFGLLTKLKTNGYEKQAVPELQDI